MITDFASFCDALLESGFSMGGGSDKGIYACVDYGWENTPEITPIKWHTGDLDTDPWEWRIRVLTERTDIAYSKLFFNASGYITREFYPCFYALRRGEIDFDSLYENGLASDAERRIYQAVLSEGECPLHEIKLLGGFTKEENGAFERALTALQMKMFITMCGQTQKTSKSGEKYGWNSTVFCTIEDFWEARGQKNMFAALPSKAEAEANIRARIKALNPSAREKDIVKFMFGR